VTPGLLAHGIGGVKDLPVPVWLFAYGGAIVLLLSFAALGALWRQPRIEGRDGGRPLPRLLQRVLLAPALRAMVGAVSVALFLVVLTAALAGARSPATNIAPTFVWVIFWLGLVPLVVLLGNVWRVLSPWAAIGDGIARLARGRAVPEPFVYPERLGRWPAALLLFCFTAFELAYTSPSDPRALGVAMLLYAAIALYGMLFFGRETWLANGDPFAVYFEFLSRLAPLAVRDGQVVLRMPMSGLTRRDARPGTLAVVAVMLGSVGFDGLSRTSFWIERRYDALVSSGGETLTMLLDLAGLAGTVALAAAAFLLAVRVAARIGRTHEGLTGVFVWSLVPIALAYVVAHYFSLLVLQGQAVVALASDPLGRGWDLFGQRDFRVDIGLLGPNTIWYVQVGALVAGHVIGLVLAHDRALVRFGSARTALRTQYPLLALMVLYTVGGMWLLSQD
jgi:hypothetical protein